MANRQLCHVFHPPNDADPQHCIQNPGTDMKPKNVQLNHG